MAEDLEHGSRGANGAALRTPRLSIVISSRDRPWYLAACIRSVRQQQCDDLEIVVADSASRSADLRKVAAELATGYVRTEQPGLSRARNHGARAARGEFIVFLDDDVTLAAGCLEALLAEFADPRVAAVGARIVAIDGDAMAREAFEAFGAFDPGPDRRVVDQSTPHWFELANFGGLGSGAVFALRHSVLAEWGGFDERLGRGSLLVAGEEMHAYFTLVCAGHRVVYTPAAIAHHPAPASLEELRQRILDSAATATAYIVLLYVEYPEHRRAVVRYALESLRGQRRVWRPKPAAARAAVVPRWRERLAWLTGPWRYAWMRVATIGRTRFDAGRAPRPASHGS
jgi:GT2 family glycosyltransferase